MTNPAVKHRVDVPVKVTERPDRNLDDLARRYPTVIAVDRDAKQLRLYKNLQLEHRYTIAVGKAGTETAARRCEIVEKIVNPPWHAPNKAWAGELAGQTIPPRDPRNPLEARWLGHNGQGIHGTKDIQSLGTAASHGCIRMSVRDVKELYTLACRRRCSSTVAVQRPAARPRFFSGLPGTVATRGDRVSEPARCPGLQKAFYRGVSRRESAHVAQRRGIAVPRRGGGGAAPRGSRRG